MKFHLPFLQKKNVVSAGYDIQGKNNKIIIVEEDGTERELGKDERIEGLNLSMAGEHCTVKIYKPYKFVDCNFDIDSQNANFEIQPNNIWGICNLHVRAMYGANQILKIGENTTFSSAYVNLDEDAGLILGKDCMIGGGVIFFPSDGHSIVDITTNKIINKGKTIVIGDHTWIGERSIVLKNTNIKGGSIFGAGSVISGVYDEENTIAAGNPAKIIKHNCTWDRTNPFFLSKVVEQEVK